MDWLSFSRPLIIGHRGASADAPENTLAAFALAQAQGADGVELDVQLSADGRAVIIHDTTVDRTTNGSGKVSDMTLAELQSLDAGMGQTIPTLDELFEMMGPGILYNVELKPFAVDAAGLATAVADRIQAHNLESQVLVSSFNPLMVRQARQHLTPQTMVAHIWYMKQFKYKYLLAKAEAHHPKHTLVDEAYMAWARKHGWRVHTWAADDPVEAQRLIDLGVNGLITNKPQFLRESLGWVTHES
ncbi:MAG TPA: glycerophosphodiester phosphodiesterase [Chloroflexi bacterium]|nr:glycerophosphodiester phosphodiesterase [Chloroflexota bacterium]